VFEVDEDDDWLKNNGRDSEVDSGVLGIESSDKLAAASCIPRRDRHKFRRIVHVEDIRGNPVGSDKRPFVDE